jgi:hypothetical protein
MGYTITLLAVGIDHADQFDARQFRQHPRMVRAHDANADNAYSQVAVCGHFDCLAHVSERTPTLSLDPSLPPSTVGAELATQAAGQLKHVWIQFIAKKVETERNSRKTGQSIFTKIDKYRAQ